MDLNEKKILVTGGAGFIGANLVKTIQKEFPRAEITVFDKFNTYEKRANGHYKFFGDYRNLVGFRGKVVAGDITNEAELLPVLNNPYDVIFHQAAISDTTELNQAEVITTNTNTFIHFLNHVKQHNTILVYASSAATYGNTAAPNIVAKGEQPENVYGFSKLMMDELASNFLSHNSNCKVIGLRYFNVYGPGEFYKRKTSSMVLQLTHQAITKRSVRLFKYGEQKRDFVYIKDVIQANIKSVSGKSGIYNVGYGVSRSFNDIVGIISETLKKNIEIEYFDNPYAFYQLNTCAEIDSSKEGIGFEPEYNLEMGVSEYVEILKELPIEKWNNFLI